MSMRKEAHIQRRYGSECKCMCKIQMKIKQNDNKPFNNINVYFGIVIRSILSCPGFKKMQIVFLQVTN